MPPTLKRIKKSLSEERKSTISDIKAALILVVATLITVSTTGDHLYIGIWYYILTISAGIALGAYCYPRPFFLTGIASALCLTLWIYANHNATASRPEGLIVFIHMFSLPGAFIGIVATPKIIKKISTSKIAALLLAVAGVLIGFFINQAIIYSALISHT
ncbi:hypothetical protein [Metapseudomonas otitidis]|uniref:hypothetical protein n=1 Tax=Metapseudomonas otitidis TaxID=319939 RepID=UPI0013F60498|nr:hypothetical protein [Pseudomonas otitidis]WAF87784.1 hypothetical protein NRL37_10145 [Pseudomonas otitidis]